MAWTPGDGILTAQLLPDPTFVRKHPGVFVAVLTNGRIKIATT